MLFKQEHKEMILNGTKTATRRAWKRPMVKVGNIYQAKLEMLSKEYFAKIKVKEFYEQELGAMTDEDAIKEGYEDVEEFRKVWIKINGWWKNDIIISVIEFELVKDSQIKTSTEDRE